LRQDEPVAVPLYPLARDNLFDIAASNDAT
jgi:hypothetical protein